MEWCIGYWGFFGLAYFFFTNMSYTRRLWIVSTAIALIYLGLKASHYSLPTFLTNHLMDIVCMPVVLGIIQGVMQFVFPSFRFTVLMLVVLVVGYSLYFECYLPQVNSRYTADLLDVGCYLIGSGLYAFFQHKDRLVT
ncbi:hypothetical protein ACFSQ0_01585 [Mesonia sediminis]|uniref:Magnesium citrate secondary transporter n=1 Tax=Mesonia sediminis TaxID=1703946 RepID=A0ABW5SA37_9FLAO